MYCETEFKSGPLVPSDETNFTCSGWTARPVHRTDSLAIPTAHWSASLAIHTALQSTSLAIPSVLPSSSVAMGCWDGWAR